MEKYLFVAFRSREHSVKFFELLRSMRVSASVINTPKEAEVGCGLSVKFTERQKNSVQKALERSSFSSLIGMFEVTEGAGRRYITAVGVNRQSVPRR